MKKFSYHIILLLVLLVTGLNSLNACTRVLNVDNGQAVLVGRTMDWYEEMKTTLMIYPRGIERNGMSSVNSLKWQSKYGSVVATVFDATTDGMNEHGLAVHMLWLDEAQYEKRDAKKYGLSVGLWAQYYLDNFKTVEEVVKLTKLRSFQLEPLSFPGTNQEITVHLALEDAAGDSAIIEYIEGELHVYHDTKYTVLTNSPSFDKQLKNAELYSGLGGNKPLPGTTDSSDRFVRGLYYTLHLPKALNTNDAFFNMSSVIENISEPYSIQSPERLDIEPTIWKTIADLSSKIYYFKSSRNFNFIWVDMNKLDFSSGAGAKRFNIEDTTNLSGDISEKFKLAN